MASEPIVAHADSIATTIPVGAVPSYAAVNPISGTVYVANYHDNTVTVINESTDTVTGTIAVGDGPYGVAVNPDTNRIYVSNEGGNTISVIDGTKNSVIDTISDNASIAGPHGLAVDPLTDTVYVASNPASVVVIDGATDTVTSTVSFSTPGCCGTDYAVAVDTATDMVYISSFGYNGIKKGPWGAVNVVNGSSNEFVETVVAGIAATDLAVNSVTNMVYSADYESGTIFVINGSTDTVSESIPQVGADGVGLNPVTDKLYVTNEQESVVTVINATTAGIISMLSVGPEPTHVAVDPSAYRVYVVSAPFMNGGPQPGELTVIEDAPLVSSSSSSAATTDISTSSTMSTTPEFPAAGSVIAVLIAALAVVALVARLVESEEDESEVKPRGSEMVMFTG